MIYVDLKGEKGSIFFELYWQDNKNVGVGPTPPGNKDFIALREKL